MTHQLTVDSVVVRFGENTVLSGGYITSRTGVVTGLLGRNGAGKSCMFRALMGGLKADYVSVHLDDTPLDIDRIGLSVKYLPQSRLIPESLTLRRAFRLYDVPFWEFAGLFPQFSGRYRAPLWELSGGEARLAELYLVLMTEAPFCILDEIEAALDDANIGYYADYLVEFSKSTQFVVVTHRKGTMERADSLYGVAMEEQGVSKMVSVSLEDYKQ